MASRLQDVLLRGLAAAKPAATTVANGTLYYSTDTAITEQSDGTAWVTYADSGAVGPPLAHAPTHALAGSDPVNLLGLAGYPGGTVNFLRADGIFAAPPAVPIRYGSLTLVIDGNGSVITTGIKGFYPIPFGCTILDWTILSTDAAVTAGSMVLDVWKKNISAGYPPTVANTITAAAKPTITTANNATSSTLTGWSPIITAGDILGINVDSVALLTKATIGFKVQL